MCLFGPSVHNNNTSQVIRGVKVEEDPHTSPQNKTHKRQPGHRKSHSPRTRPRSSSTPLSQSVSPTIQGLIISYRAVRCGGTGTLSLAIKYSPNNLLDDVVLSYVRSNEKPATTTSDDQQRCRRSFAHIFVGNSRVESFIYKLTISGLGGSASRFANIN